MPIDLTDADRAAIARIVTHASICTTTYPSTERDDALYRAGLAAGRERAIEDAARTVEDKDARGAAYRRDLYGEGHADAVESCAAAIRALLK